MKINTIQDQLIYIPNREFHNGESIFDGEFKCDEKLYEILHQEGIDYIKSKLLSLIECRKEMFGEYHILHYGMNPLQHFYDLKNRISIQIEDLLLPENNQIILTNDEERKWLKHKSNKKAFEMIRGRNTL